MDQNEAADREVGIEMIDRLRLLVEHAGKPAGGNHGHRLAVFGDDARDKTFHQSEITPIKARLHGRDRIFADDGL